MTKRDRGQPLDRTVSRRDILNGIAVAVGAGIGSAGEAEAATRALPYPPGRTGLRGAHAGSFETLHRVRDGTFWANAPLHARRGARYDLVVVGAGISGLTAAYAYQKARPGASILILDNHDDFGGHATRNELGTGRARRIGYGGSQSIDSPLPYSREAKALIAELGIRVEDYGRYEHATLYHSLGLRRAFFFDRETYGSDRLVPHDGRRPERDADFIAAAPISEGARRDLVRLTTERFDPYPGETEVSKRRRLARISYLDFLRDVWRVEPGAAALFQNRPHFLYGVGIDAVPAQDAHGLGLPGFLGLGLGPQPGPGQNYDSIRSAESESFYFHFPDGNATLARLLVQRLLPGAVPGRAVERMVTSWVDYSRLDRPGASVRIRLRSPVVRVRHLRPGGASGPVEVTCQRGRRLESVRADRVILACWHTMIPYICADVPAAQREAMSFAVKVPVVYTNVLVRNWRALHRLGVSRIASPGFWHTSVGLDFPVSMGAYRFPQSPDEPIVLHLTKAACKPGLSARDQHRAGRREIYDTTFEEIERGIRAQLDRVLGPGGFDARRDILAITVNRWPHGYSYQYNSLFDEFWLDGGRTPCEIARQPFGRIAIANADAGAYGYADGAIDHGLRAAREALALG